jgi:type I restriction enzyme S subunit
MGLHNQVRVSQARRAVTFNQDVKALVPKSIEPSLLLFALLDGQTDLLRRVESSGHGTGKLPSDVLLRHTLTLPPTSQQKPFAQVFDAVNARIEVARTEARVLADIRDTLLPQLLSGERSAIQIVSALESVA